MENIKSVFRTMFQKGKLKNLSIFTLSWTKIVGEQAAKHSKPARFENKTLYVWTSSPVWANQLQFLSQEIVEQINNELGNKTVKEVRFMGVGLNKTKDNPARRRPVS